jgi:two-component system OmpR family response regulator
MEARRRILVVEDDPETAGQLLESLTANGYRWISRWMRPDLDGIAVMQQLRQDGIATPVLIVSALGELDDRVRRTSRRRWKEQTRDAQSEHFC